MPRARTSMRKIREVLRLKWERRLSHRQVERSLQMGRGTVGGYLRRAVAAGLSWEQVTALGDEELEGRLFPSEVDPPAGSRVLPDWSQLHQELKRPGVTLQLLWEEYRERQPAGGYRYSRFCEQYRAWRGPARAVSCARSTSAARSCSSTTPGKRCRSSTRPPARSAQAQIFVAVLGASELHLRRGDAEPGPRRTGSARTCGRFEFFGGVPRAGRARPPEERCHAPLPLRARAQPHLRRSWPSTTASPCCRRGCASRATRPRSKAACCW